MKRWTIGLVATVAAVSIAVGYGMGRARAYGLPSTNTLAYSGTLMTFGQPDNSTHNMSIALWVPGASSSVCGSALPVSTAVVNGQFSLPLPPQCVTAIHQNPNLQAQITIDGTPLGFSSLAAVPYAIEAGSVTSTPMLANVGLSATTASFALTVNLLQSDGQSTPSIMNPAIIGFRTLAPGSGALNPIQVTSALSLTVPSGATLGQVSGAAEHTYVYAQDNAGTVQLCVNTAGYLDEGSLQTSFALGASSTSRTLLYCTNAATGPIRLIGRLLSIQSTAGSWVVAPGEVALPPFDNARVTSSAASRLDIEFGYFSNGGPTLSGSSNCNANPCVVSNQSPGVVSVTRGGTGGYTINFTPGTFSVPPSCTFSVISAGNYLTWGGWDGSSANSYTFVTSSGTNGYTPWDSQGSFMCVGFH